MAGKPKRNTQAEHELGDLCDGVTKMSPLIERPQAEREVYRRRGVERGIDERNSPPPDVPGQPRIHRGVGDVAKCVIEEMRENVREHDEPTGKAHLAYANTAQPCRNP